eukprot:1160377-Pelagomonas_calceolata.AAC.8
MCFARAPLQKEGANYEGLHVTWSSWVTECCREVGSVGAKKLYPCGLQCCRSDTVSGLLNWEEKAKETGGAPKSSRTP